ncbi:MAG: DoxX family membrane protein [Bacteroidetes bacterium]|nr:DoxX family membrane protein [Bacteroidota bacterium]
MRYTSSQLTFLVLLRVFIGWHFLYEGASKLLNPAWSGKSYLLDSKGFMSGFYEWIAGNNSLLMVSDFMNEWGLTLIGLSLILGIFTRISGIAGIILLLLYYLSHPAWPGLEYLMPVDGSYFIINKNIIEILALLVMLVFPTSHIIGLERIFRIKL